MDGRVWEALHVAHALRAIRRIRPHAQPSGLAAAGLLRSSARRRWSPPSTASPSRRSCPPTAPRVGLRVDLRRRPGPRSRYLATIYHGVDLAALPFSPVGGDDLVVLGRIHPDKGTADAIRISQRSGRRLLIAGIIQDQEYFDERRTTPPRRRQGGLPGIDRTATTRRIARRGHGAAAPDRISTNRSGCPSSKRWCAALPSSPIAAGPCRRSSTSVHTGFLVPGVDEAVAAVEQVAQLDRHRCHTIAAPPVQR